MRRILFLSLLVSVCFFNISCRNNSVNYYQEQLSSKIDLNKYDIILLFADYHCSECKEEGLIKLKQICIEENLAMLGIYHNSYSQTSFKYDAVINQIFPEIYWSNAFSESEKSNMLQNAQQQTDYILMPILIFLKDGTVESLQPLTYLQWL